MKIDITQVATVEDLKPGFAYLVFWIEQRYESQKEGTFLKVVELNRFPGKPSCVATNGGNRTFDKHLWYGPIPMTIAGLSGFTPSASESHPARA